MADDKQTCDACGVELDEDSDSGLCVDCIIASS